MMEFDNLNGFLVEKGDKLFDMGNRSLKYGDGLFETIKLVGGKMMFWDDHYDRLKRGIDHLKIDDTGKEKEFLVKEIERVIVKNYYKEAKLRLIIFRDAPGLYTPMSNRLGFIVEGVRFDSRKYNFDPKGISMGLFESEFKAISPMSNLKTTSALLFVLASVYKKEQGWDDAIVLNSTGRVCEACSSNVFVRINDQVFTPALSEGCLDGVMRKQVKKYLKSKHQNFVEGEVTIEQLNQADEIVLTNSVAGVQGVATYNGKALEQTLAHELQKYLNFLVDQF